jgi:hypothetical protein
MGASGGTTTAGHRRWLARAPAWLLLTALALVLRVTACAPHAGCGGQRGCTSVLFLGNSYTSANDLPGTLAALAASGRHSVGTQTLAQGGETLAQHAASPADGTAITSGHWDYVVLQEQSEIPSLAGPAQAEMYPAATRLITMIRDAGGQPLLFLTWGHQDGWPQAGLGSYPAMQAALDQGYQNLSAAQHVPVAPVGWAWWTLLGHEPGAVLWQSDGSHPTTEGTYLAACVFYATIFHQSPVGLSDHDGLSDTEAARVQAAAATAVLGDQQAWGPSGPTAG